MEAQPGGANITVMIRLTASHDAAWLPLLVIPPQVIRRISTKPWKCLWCYVFYILGLPDANPGRLCVDEAGLMPVEDGDGEWNEGPTTANGIRLFYHAEASHYRFVTPTITIPPSKSDRDTDSTTSRSSEAGCATRLRTATASSSALIASGLPWMHPSSQNGALQANFRGSRRSEPLGRPVRSSSKASSRSSGKEKLRRDACDRDNGNIFDRTEIFHLDDSVGSDISSTGPVAIISPVNFQAAHLIPKSQSEVTFAWLQERRCNEAAIGPIYSKNSLANCILLDAFMHLYFGARLPMITFLPIPNAVLAHIDDYPPIPVTTSLGPSKTYVWLQTIALSGVAPRISCLEIGILGDTPKLPPTPYLLPPQWLLGFVAGSHLLLHYGVKETWSLLPDSVPPDSDIPDLTLGDQTAPEDQSSHGPIQEGPTVSRNPSSHAKFNFNGRSVEAGLSSKVDDANRSYLSDDAMYRISNWAREASHI